MKRAKGRRAKACRNSRETIGRNGIASLCLLVTLLTGGCTTRPLPDTAEMAHGGLGNYYQNGGAILSQSVQRPEFFDSGPAIKAEMLRLTDEARDYILVDSFLLTDGPEAREVLDALAEKHREGVRVYLIGDSSSRFVPEPHAFDYLSGAGVPAAEFHAIRGLRALYLPNLIERDHRKFWVVDGRTLFLGGANLNDPSLTPPEAGGNLDLMAKVASPAAAREMVHSFVETWNGCEDVEPLDINDFEVPDNRPEPSDGTAFWLFNQDLLTGSAKTTEEMFDGLFASAQDSIWLIQPYTFVNPHILSRIREMNGRGVEVNVVLSDQARAPRFRYASHFGIRDMIKAGARVWIYESEVTPLHYKCALVDDDLAYVGSSNLNLRSFRLSRELNAVFQDPSSVSEVRRVVDSVIADSHAATEEEANSFRSPRYFSWWLVMQVAG